MSITDELRKWLKSLYTPNSATVKDEGEHIADRIDAEHERQCAESWMRGHDAWAAIDHEDAMAEHGWVKLPVDADGVPFHIGDKVDSDHYEDGTIIGIHYFRAPNGVVFEEIAVQPNGWDTATWRDPEEYAHHHEPTVEDVLRQIIACANNGTHVHGALDTEQIVAEYAAKLRLAGDAE